LICEFIGMQSATCATKSGKLKPELSTVSDEELASRSKTGSLEAFEQLVLRYERRVFAFVSQFCNNPADAQEVTQDTFVKACQRIAQFDSRRTFAPWLFTIARRNCIDRHRKIPPPSEPEMPEPVDDTNPSELMAKREEGQNLWRLARERLGQTQFEALWLHYAEDMDVAQIAQVLGKTRVHVKVLLFRARQVLARTIGAPASGPARSSKLSAKAGPKAGAPTMIPPFARFASPPK
jgi:RNA polymerase sigma-70 factor (ECF subfamily)